MRAIVFGTYLMATAWTLKADPEAGTYYFHADHLGSVVAISNAENVVTDRIGYSAYGSPLAESGHASVGVVRFTGKSLDGETGNYYFDARYLDGTTGRFMSPDPARQLSSPYLYVGAAPLENVDPDGRVLTGAEEALIFSRLGGKTLHVDSGFPRVPTSADILNARIDRLEFLLSRDQRGVSRMPSRRELRDKALDGLLDDIEELEAFYMRQQDTSFENVRLYSEGRARVRDVSERLRRTSIAAEAKAKASRQVGQDFSFDADDMTVTVPGLGASGDPREEFKLDPADAVKQINEKRSKQLDPQESFYRSLANSEEIKTHMLEDRLWDLRMLQRDLARVRIP